MKFTSYILKYFLIILTIIISNCYGVNVNSNDIKKNQLYILQEKDKTFKVLCGGTLVSEHITLTTANDISDKNSNYHAVMFGDDDDEEKHKFKNALIKVIFYDYQQRKNKNNFGLLIFRDDLTQKGNTPALLLNHNENIEIGSKTFVTALRMIFTIRPVLQINNMQRTKCKSADNDQIICNIMFNQNEQCMITESGAMFKQVERIGGQRYYALGGIVIQPANRCDPNNPALVLRTNVQNVLEWIQGIKSGYI